MAKSATARRRGNEPDSNTPSIDAQPTPVKPTIIVPLSTSNAVSGENVPSCKSPAELISSVDALTAFEDGMSFMAFAARSLAQVSTSCADICLQDEFSKCFEPRERTAYHPVSLMYLLWLFGIVFRYGCLFPFRYMHRIRSVLCLLTAQPERLVLFARLPRPAAFDGSRNGVCRAEAVALPLIVPHMACLLFGVGAVPRRQAASCRPTHFRCQPY